MYSMGGGRGGGGLCMHKLLIKKKSVIEEFESVQVMYKSNQCYKSHTQSLNIKCYHILIWSYTRKKASKNKTTLIACAVLSWQKIPVV